jgi:hypothetical protein
VLAARDHQLLRDANLSRDRVAIEVGKPAARA